MEGKIKIEDLPVRYEKLCRAARNRSCWGMLHPDFFYLRCVDRSGDCYHRLAGKPISKVAAKNPLTEPETIIFKNRKLWRLAIPVQDV